MRRLHYLVLVIPLIAGDGAVHADSVAQVQTAKRISEQTVQLIDPQGGTSTGGAGSNVNYAVGDVLTFQIRFTPVENNATRGFGGYITEYVPPNTEVVGARIVDDSGNTVCPHRGGFGAIGWGPRGANNYNPANFPTFPAQGYLQGEGGMSALYADTGVFYSIDPRTVRVPEDDFTTVFEGLVMSCTPTGAGQLDDLLGANLGGPYFAHNDWDNIQLVGYGCSSSTIGDGTGNTPFGYGSAVAGPDTFYPFEATETMPGVVAAVGAIGPWQRVKTPCAEIGTGVPALQRGPIATRVGVPTSAGWALSGDNPLPAGTNAVRFAVGELVVGDEYLAEISLRVLAAPLDPNFCNDPPGCVDLGADVNCSEVFGGDASGRAKDGSDGGKDNTWRYFLPGPACVKLDLQFDLDVDKIQALSGDTLVYSLTARNLDSVNTHDMVDISLDLLAGVGTVNFVSATNGGTVNAGVVTWPTTTLAPGDFVEHEVTVVATGNNSPILARANYSSDQLAGFSVVSLTNLTPLALLDLEMFASPASSTAGGTVTYTAFITNNGTGAANFGCASCGITIKLPAGFTVVPGTVQVDGTGVGNPAGPPPQYVFSSGLPVLAANGGFTQLVFDVLIDGATAPGVYRSDLETYMRDPGAGREIDDAVAQIAPVLVDVVQSDVPTVVTPISSGSTMVCGTSTEPNGATIRVYVDLLEVGTTTRRW